MDTTYNLTEKEQCVLKKYQTQFAECQSIVEQAKKLAKEKEADMIAVKGAFQGALQMIGEQQGLTPNGDEKLSIDPELHVLTVVTDA